MPRAIAARLGAWLFIGAVLPVLLMGCGLDPDKIPSHELYATDGQRRVAGDRLAFAVVGSTRAAVPRLRGEDDVATEVIRDLHRQSQVRDLSFVVLTGDYVSRSTNREWRGFDERWKDLLDGETASDNQRRASSQPLVGRGELAGDRRLRGLGAAFDGVGKDIGHNRVASWSTFDAEVAGTVWRFLFLDTHRSKLGSRWQEQVFWLPKVLVGDDYDRLLVFLPDALVSLGSTMDAEDGPSSLLGIIEDHTELDEMQVVFAGGGATNELHLPGGVFAEAHVLAGNAGVPAEDLRRWGAADEAGLLDISLESGFDLALLEELQRWVDPVELPDRVIERATASGAWEGYTGVYDGAAFPIVGWWVVELRGDRIELVFRMRRYDGSFHDLYGLDWVPHRGWARER